MDKSKVNDICSCYICRNNHSFSMPQELIEAIVSNNLVVFAGAGVSTESPYVCKSTLYQDIRSELEIEENEDVSFSKLMSLYCDRPDGKRELYLKIWHRLNFVKSFEEAYDNAVRFHRELSTMHHIKEIITTNWDDFFEEECGAIPIVNSKDFVFWSLPQRKVFKIHGCVRNISSIVATKEDYDRCYKELSSGCLIGDNLRMLLATKKVLFIGYSFNDEDFNSIYSLLFNQMSDLIPHAYIVTLDENLIKNLQVPNFTPIVTDAKYFISELKKHIVEKGLMLKDDVFEKVYEQLYIVQNVHNDLMNAINPKEYPAVVYSYCYQDGIIHSFQRILKMNKTGEYSCPGCVSRLINSYIEIKKEKLRDRNYFDIAYIDGYIDGLNFLLIDDKQRSDITPFYIYGYKYIIATKEEFVDIIKSQQIFHKSANKKAKKIVCNISDSVTIHHPPFL